MNRLDRRRTLQLGAGAVAGFGLGMGLGGRPARSAIAVANPTPPNLPIEKGATLRILRPAKFVQGDETLFLANSKKFTEKSGVEVRVDSEGWEDMRPKTAVAANVGTGPDVILAWQEDPHLFENKTLPLDDIANYLGEKYGGWFKVADFYGKNAAGKWIAMPIGGSGATVVTRGSWLKEAGYDKVPGDFPGFLKCCQDLQKIKHPVAFALGNAVGDGGWTDWILWGYGASLIDENSKVSINVPETIAALEYAAELYQTFIPGTMSWLDPSNNKAFLTGEISLTSNGISIYYAAKTSTDPAMQAIARDILHEDFPIGPAGIPTQGATVINSMVMGYTKYPNAAKEYLRFMMEEEQYGPWLEASIGYWGHPLAAYDNAPIWTSDPKIGAYKNVMRQALPQSYKGRPSEAAAAAKADFVTLNMFQNVCAGKQTPKEAAAEAERRAKRYFGA